MSGKKEKQSNPQNPAQGQQKQKQQQQQNKGNDSKNNQKKQQQGKQQANQKKGGAAQGHEDDVKRDQKLQAVILADSFSQTFRPITLEKPKVLLPVVNIPMLDYTIEFLAQNGVEEIIVYCVWYGNLIEEYINNSKWSSIISIKCVCQPTCGSAGDALRELDSLNIVRSDPFILISGDVVSNMNLKKAIDYHKMKRKQDPNNIMTCVLKKIQQVAPSKSLLDDLVIGLHPNSSQILFFEDSIGKDEISFSLELLTDNNTNEILFYNDLLDCNIDICSQELLLQFSDNFDYQVNLFVLSV
jgi:translation initiation factor eIF-2B subunit epsilon